MKKPTQHPKSKVITQRRRKPTRAYLKLKRKKQMMESNRLARLSGWG